MMQSYQPLIDAMRGIAADMLAMMQSALRGDSVDDAQYSRVFGSKEGMVPQLQKLCDLVEELHTLEAAVAPAPAQESTDTSDAYERALIAHYVQAYRAHTIEPVANADDT